MRAVRWAGTGVVMVLLMHVAGLTSRALGAPVGSDAVSTVLACLTLGAAAAVCCLRAVLVRADRTGWIPLCAGLVCYAVGALLHAVGGGSPGAGPVGSDTGTITAADLFSLALAPLSAIGLWLIVRPRLGARSGTRLDALVAALGVAAVAALFVSPRTGGVQVLNVTEVAHPLADLSLAAAVTGAMIVLRAWRHSAWTLLTVGFVVFTTSHAWSMLLGEESAPAGGLQELPALAGLTMVALAAARPPVSDAPDHPDGPVARNLEFLTPVLFGVLPVAVLVAGSLSTEKISPVAVVLALAALVAVVLRTAMAVREVVDLSDQRRLARTDSLTGLPNRRAFYDLLEDDRVCSGSVLIIDLDRFKEINDALGHRVGDDLLSQVAGRLAAQVPEPGVIARLGGDEFAVHLPVTAREGAAKRAAGLLRALEDPFTVSDTLLHVGASIGITGRRPGTGAGRALAEADMAMYRAKSARTGFELYDDTQDSSAWDRLALIEGLRRTLDQGGLTLAFQPIVDARTGQTRSAEALVRWIDAERGFVPPDVFLPLAEHAGLMPALTRTVLDLALEEARQLRRLGFAVPVSVNLSASDLLDARLEQELAGRLQALALPASAVKIEITESLLVDSSGRAGGFLLAMRELGIELLVDDFGTGYSSMAYLHDLPVSTLKIDRAFTSRLSSDARTGVIVASTIEMAHRLGLSVVAEGVETQSELDWLREQGCDMIQGYLVSRPVPGQDLRTWLAEQRSAAESAASGG